MEHTLDRLLEGLGVALTDFVPRLLGAVVVMAVALVAAVVFAFVNAVVHLAFLPAYPVWSILMITFDVVVIYAITVHGSEVAASA